MASSSLTKLLRCNELTVLRGNAHGSGATSISGCCCLAQISAQLPRLSPTPPHPSFSFTQSLFSPMAAHPGGFCQPWHPARSHSYSRGTASPRR